MKSKPEKISLRANTMHVKVETKDPSLARELEDIIHSVEDIVRERFHG